MWIGHYILGLLFYLTVNMAIFVEGIPALLNHPFEDPKVIFLGEQDMPMRWKVLVPSILTAHLLQNTYHAYLYNLRAKNSTYQLPSHPLFPNIICPHYTLEVLIYIFLSILAAPSRRIVNWTMASAVVFVAVNLGVTAHGTKDWYTHRFGKEKVKGRYKMVPWIW